MPGLTREQALEQENARLRKQIELGGHKPPASKRPIQPVLFNARAGGCANPACGHWQDYPVFSKEGKGLRLRNTPCARCGKPLGRGSYRRALPEVKKKIRQARRRHAAVVVARLAVKMRVPPSP